MLLEESDKRNCRYRRIVSRGIGEEELFAGKSLVVGVVVVGSVVVMDCTNECCGYGNWIREWVQRNCCGGNGSGYIWVDESEKG